MCVCVASGSGNPFQYPSSVKCEMSAFPERALLRLIYGLLMEAD